MKIVIYTDCLLLYLLLDYIWITLMLSTLIMRGLCVYFCMQELLDSNDDFVITVLQGEARRDIGQFGNFRRSGRGDDALEIAVLPGT